MNKIQPRYKNIWFWFGLVATFLNATGIVPEDLKTWDILIDKIVAVLMNPYALGCAVIAIVAVFVNPKTKGIKD